MSSNTPRLGVDHPTVVPAEPRGDDNDREPTDETVRRADDALDDG
ncbi:hypothetical protein [Halobellus captivus]|nr:hypothetical protein [Halobellus captivus]